MFEAFIIAVICIFGCSYQCYKTGLNEGTVKALEILHERKIITYDDKGNIIELCMYNSDGSLNKKKT